MFIQKDSDDLLDYEEFLRDLKQDPKDFDLEEISDYVFEGINQDDELHDLTASKKLEYFKDYMRDKGVKPNKCDHCDKEISPKSSICDECATQDQEDLYVCGDCGLECSMDDRLKYCDPKCPACKDEINAIRENQ